MTFSCQFCHADYHHEGEIGIFVGVCLGCGVERCGESNYQAAIDRAEISISRGDAARKPPTRKEKHLA